MPLFLILTLVLVPTLAFTESATSPHCQTAVMSETAPHVLPIAQETKLDRCDSRLWGEWECTAKHLALSSRIDSSGIERVNIDWSWGPLGIEGEKSSHPVDRKWHPNSKTKKHDKASCNGWNEDGFRELIVMTRDSPGKKSANMISYFVDNSDRLWTLYQDVSKDQNGKVTIKENARYACDRD